jgi:hypothetical protein
MEKRKKRNNILASCNAFHMSSEKVWSKAAQPFQRTSGIQSVDLEHFYLHNDWISTILIEWIVETEKRE